MNLIKRIFGKKQTETKEVVKSAPVLEEIVSDKHETDVETYIKTEEGAYIFNKEKMPEYSYSDLSEEQYKHIKASVSILAEAFAPLLKFDYQPTNHPKNLDEYLTVWGSSGFGRFLGVEAEQHAAFLAYNFGQYLVDQYAMSWQIKSDEQGSQIVVRNLSLQEIELYPIDSTLRAIEKKEFAIYAEIDDKLKRTFDMFQ